MTRKKSRSLGSSETWPHLKQTPPHCRSQAVALEVVSYGTIWQPMDFAAAVSGRTGLAKQGEALVLERVRCGSGTPSAAGK